MTDQDKFRLNSGELNTEAVYDAIKVCLDDIYVAASEGEELAQHVFAGITLMLNGYRRAEADLTRILN